MTITNISNLVDTQILADSIQASMAGLPVLAATGAAQIVTGMPSTNGEGTTVTVPYFGTLGAFESISDGSALAPAQMVSSSETALVKRVGKAAQLSVWAQGNGTDPVTAMTQDILKNLTQAIDSQLLAVAQDGTGWGSYSYDGYSSGAGTITYDKVVEAMSLFGDEGDDIAAIIVPSKIAKDVRLLKDSTGRPLFTEAVNYNTLPSLMGIPMITSNKVTAVSDGYGQNLYKSLIIKKNALVAWVSDISDSSIAIQRDILTHTDIFAINTYAAFHRYKVLPGMSKPGVVIMKTL